MTAGPAVEERSALFPRVGDGRLVAAASHTLTFWGVDGARDDRRALRSAIAPGLLVEGRWPLMGALDEIVIGTGLMRETDLAVGDAIEVSAPAAAGQFTIVGVAMHTSRAPYPTWDTAGVFVSAAALEVLAGERIFFARGVRLEDPNAVLAFVSSVSANRGGLGATDWLQVRDDIAEDGEAAWITLAAMSVFVLLGSGVILANAAAAVAAGRSRDVALLKAIGATPLQVTGLLLGEMLVLGLGGALLGVAAGALTAPLFLREVAQLLDTTARPVVGPAGIVTIVLAVEALLLLFTAVPAWRSGRLSTVVALRGASAASEFAPSRLVGLASALRLPRGVAIGLKDLFARPARAWLTVAAVAVAAATVSGVLTFEATFEKAFSEPEFLGNRPFEVHVERLPGSPSVGALSTSGPPPPALDELVAMLRARPEVEAHLTERSFFSVIEDLPGRPELIARAVGGEVGGFDWRVLEGRMLEGAGEVVVGFGIAQRLGLGVGDPVTMLLALDEERQTLDLTVVGVAVLGGDDLGVALFPLADLRALDADVDAGRIGLKLAAGTDRPASAAAVVEATGGRVVVTDVRAEAQDNVDELRSTVRPIALPLSGILVGVAGVNLLGTLTLGVRERRREFGILKAVGMTPGQIIGGVLAGAALLGVLGVVVGTPLGVLFMRWVLIWAVDEQGLPNDFVQLPGLAWLAASALLLTAVAVLAALLPAIRAAHSTVAAAVRYE